MPPIPKWGIWCLPTESWVINPTHLNGYSHDPARYDTRKEANADIKDFALREHWKDYEPRKIP